MVDVNTQVTRIIVNKIGVEEAKVTPNASLRNDLGFDSLGSVDLGMELESQFNIQIPDEECEKFSTVRDIINYITSNASLDS